MGGYVWASVFIAGLSFIITLIWYANRAGRNASRVRSEAKDAATAAEESAASQRALAARTNGIRSDNQLLDTLDKGQF